MGIKKGGSAPWHEVAERVLQERRSGKWRAHHSSTASWIKTIAQTERHSASLIRRWSAALAFIEKVGGADGWPSFDVLRHQRHFNIELLARLCRVIPEEARTKAWALAEGRPDRLSVDGLKSVQSGLAEERAAYLRDVVIALGEPTDLRQATWPTGTWLSAPDAYLERQDRGVAVLELRENSDTWRHSLCWAVGCAQMCTACWIIGPVSAGAFLHRAVSQQEFVETVARNIGIGLTSPTAIPRPLRVPKEPMHRSPPAEPGDVTSSLHSP
jgi:hypothetical protein